MKNFYAINLNGKYHTLSRWSLYYLDKKKEMSVVWAEPNEKFHNDNNAPIDKQYTKIPGMVFYPRRDGAPDKYPAFHFAVKGLGINHLDDLADTLAAHYKEDIEILHLHGHYPSRHFMEYKERK
jgi:hypothetical protein